MKGLEKGSGRNYYLVVRRNWSKGLPWVEYEKRFVFERVGTVQDYVYMCVCVCVCKKGF